MRKDSCMIGILITTMAERIPESSREQAPILRTATPAVESFFDTRRFEARWPKEVARNKEVLEQIEIRKQLQERLAAVFDALPTADTHVTEALETGDLTEKQLSDCYASLCATLEDPDYGRLGLYLPFELMPDLHTFQPRSTELVQRTNQFVQTYMETWASLLYVQDVRANFIDGDVIEIELRTEENMPYVVKAAHLTPMLVERGFMTLDDAFHLMETKDPILNRSMAETLPLMADMGLLDAAAIDRIARHQNPIIQKMYQVIEHSFSAQEREPQEPLDVASIEKALSETLAEIEAHDYGDLPPRRIWWLKLEETRMAIEALSDQIATHVEEHELDTDAILQSDIPELRIALIDGVRKAIERADDPEDLFAQHEVLFAELVKQQEEAVEPTLRKALFRIEGTGGMSAEQLGGYGLERPTLRGPFSENMKRLEKERAAVRQIIAELMKDPDMNDRMYPTALVFGSQLKGYGTRESDLDVGVFIKPDVSHDDRKLIREKLKIAFAAEPFRGEALEFWLTEGEEGLTVHDFGEPDPKLAERGYAHILFGSAWEGDPKAIIALHEQLLTPMLSNKSILEGRPARKAYLEEIEKNTLLYRLLHKGYERYHPSVGGLDAGYEDVLGGNSLFWDSGYRQTATTLYANQVFLPKIEQ